ncbi:MAG: hypothetical protein KIT79_13790 [Deltaproteobacteria bacterium]|nr:hypothetical protein [Deltaproteobacteria bacterium]
MNRLSQQGCGRWRTARWLAAMALFAHTMACGGRLPEIPVEPEAVSVGAFLVKPYTGSTPPACDASAPPAFGPLAAGDAYNVLVVALGEGGSGFSPVFNGLVELSSSDPNDGTTAPRAASGGCVTFLNQRAVTAGTGLTITADTPAVRGARSPSAPFDVTLGPAARLAVRVLGISPGDPLNPAQVILPSATGPQVVGSPLGLRAGVPFDVEVIVTDALGNTVVDTPTVSVEAPFDPNVAPQLGAPGIYTMTIYRAAPTQRVSVVDQALLLARGDTAFFAVGAEPGGAAELAVALPGQVIQPTPGGFLLTPFANTLKVGQSFSVRVAAVDIFGNVVSAATDTIELFNTSAPGTQIPVSRLNLTLGQASFTVAARSAQAGQQLDASGNVLPVASSEMFDIDPPDPVLLTLNFTGVTPGQAYLGGPAAYRLDAAAQTPTPTETGEEFTSADYRAVKVAGDGLVTSSGAPDTPRRLLRLGGAPTAEFMFPSRTGTSCAYDSARSQMVLFGGQNGFDLFEDTWEWDGSVLQQVSPGSAGDTRPEARTAHGMAYVPGMGVAVFGGLTARERVNDLWFWDGATWMQPAQTGAPSPRLGAAVSYDQNAGVLIVFGGETATGDSAELWAWDGAAWSLQPVTGPPPGARAGAKLVYDPVRATHVLAGGRSPSGLAQDHYELSYSGVWPGGTWIWARRNGVDISTVPPGRTSHVAVFDTGREVVMVQGGITGSTNPAVAANLWEFDENSINGPEWATSGGAGGLPPLSGAAGCFDEIRGVLVVAGGGMPSAALNRSIYRWNSATRLAVTDLAPGSAGPSERGGAAMAYMPDDESGFAIGRILLFGGRDGTSGTLRNDLWMFDGNLWSPVAVESDGTSFPPPMSGANLSFDSGRGRLVLYGGTAAHGPVRQIWDLRRVPVPLTGIQFRMNADELIVESGDGNLVAELSPGEFVEVDGTSAVVSEVVNGNLARLSTVVADTGSQPSANRLLWQFSAWVDPGAGGFGLPPERHGAASAYDEVNGSIVVFGGALTSGLSAETWLWDGSAWSFVPVSGFPRPRHREGAAMAFDPVSGAVLLFGGQGTSGLLSDTWLWDGEYWTVLATTGSTPPPMRDASLARAGGLGLILAGGTDASGASVPGEWFWDGMDWHQLGTFDSSAGRGLAAVAYDEMTEMVVIAGGTGGTASETILFPLPQANPWEAGRFAVELYEFPVNLPSSTVVTNVAVTVRGAGRGSGGDGTDVYVQDSSGAWTYAGGHSEAPRLCAHDADPGQCALDRTITASLPGSGHIRRGRVHVAVSSASSSSAMVRALQSTDFIEVVVSYLP